MRRRSLLLSLVVVIVVGTCGPLTSATANAAQESTPEVRFPVTPTPAECTVKPRPAESLAALLGTPVADGAPATAPPSFKVLEVPVGQPADEEVAVSIFATVRELHACFNANDSLRAFALFSDAFLQGYVERNSLTNESIAMLLIPASEPVLVEAQTTVLAVTDVTMLPDGRAATFVVTSSEWRGPDTSYMLFVRNGERWLLDEVIAFAT